MNDLNFNNDFCYYTLLKRKWNLIKSTWSFEESQRVCVHKARDLSTHTTYTFNGKHQVKSEWIWASPCAFLLVCWDIFLLRAFYLMNSGGGNPRRPSFFKKKKTAGVELGITLAAYLI